MKPQEDFPRADHIGIFTAYPKRMMTFYVNKLEFKKEYQTILDKDTVYSIFSIRKDCNMVKLKRGAISIELFWFNTDTYKVAPKVKSRVGYNHFGLAFKDRQSFLDELRKKKIKIIEIKRQDRYAYFINDPEGNLIEIREPPK